MKKEGANRGAVTSFVIATPESSIDSISVTWALLDPIMTIVRPVCAFLMAVTAGLGVNFLHKDMHEASSEAAGASSCDQACCKEDAGPSSLRVPVTPGLFMKTMVSVWGEISGWFFIGVAAAGLVTAMVPAGLLQEHFGGGPGSMLLMLLAGIPLYICATASTPLAAALILKGASPGAALVLMLTGPATNITAVSSLFPIIGKRAVAIYLAVIAGFAVAFGLGVDWLYGALDLDIRSVALSQGGRVPDSLKWGSALMLLLFSSAAYAGRVFKGRDSEKSGNGRDLKPSCCSSSTVAEADSAIHAGARSRAGESCAEEKGG